MRRSSTLEGAALLVLLMQPQGPQEPPPDPVGFIITRDIRLLRMDAAYGYWDVCIRVRIGRYGPAFPYWTLWRAPLVGTWTADEAIRWSRLQSMLEVRGLLGYPLPPPGWAEADLVVAWCWGPDQLAELQQFMCGQPERMR